MRQLPPLSFNTDLNVSVIDGASSVNRTNAYLYAYQFKAVTDSDPVEDKP